MECETDKNLLAEYRPPSYAISETQSSLKHPYCRALFGWALHFQANDNTQQAHTSNTVNYRNSSPLYTGSSAARGPCLTTLLGLPLFINTYRLFTYHINPWLFQHWENPLVKRTMAEKNKNPPLTSIGSWIPEANEVMFLPTCFRDLLSLSEVAILTEVWLAGSLEDTHSFARVPGSSGNVSEQQQWRLTQPGTFHLPHPPAGLVLTLWEMTSYLISQHWADLRGSYQGRRWPYKGSFYSYPKKHLPGTKLNSGGNHIFF